jgi:cell wall-associated NlpC family hydrolase
VRLVLQERFGKELPAFDDYERADRNESEHQVALGLKALDVRPVESPQEGDIALMRIRGALNHVGLYLGGGEILHTMRGTYSVIESAASPRICTKIEGYYHVG